MTDHLQDYLTYYQTCSSPGFAVLVTGAWGTGKTHQVKRVLPEAQRFYVSLFGLQTPQEIHAEIAAAMDPTLSTLKKLLSNAGNIGNQAPGVWKLTGSGAAIVNSLIKTRSHNRRTIVFDDLERCPIALNDILGVLNQYIEHFGCRVVVIAHDEKVATEFIASKEKIFGQTIKIEPQVVPAFDAFVEIQSSPARAAFLTTHRDTILLTFQQSNQGSLRILKQVMEDLGRLFDVLTEAHFKKTSAMTRLIGLFTALDIECRAGLTEADLRGRQMTAAIHQLQQDKASVPPPLAVANAKYEGVDLNDELLTDDTLVNIFIKGLYQPEQILTSLAGSIYFTEPAKLPAWRRVMSFDKLENDVVIAALEEMNVGFRERAYTIPGEILHVFALKLLLAENNIETATLEEVEVACRKYLEDLVEVKRMPRRGNDWRWQDDIRTGYGGYGYWVTNIYKDRFEALARAVNDARVRALEPAIQGIIDEILSALRTDGDLFYGKLNTSPTGGGDYAYIPILHRIPIQTFYEAWMSSPKENWYTISAALNERYKSQMRSIGLEDECEWFKSLVELMTREVSNNDGFEALRLQRAIPRLG